MYYYRMTVCEEFDTLMPFSAIMRKRVKKKVCAHLKFKCTEGKAEFCEIKLSFAQKTREQTYCW